MGKPIVRKIGKLNKYHRMRNNNITNVDNKLKKIMVENMSNLLFIVHASVTLGSK